MNFELTDEQAMIQAMAREFAESEIAPIAAEIDRDARFPHETVKRMGELGLMGIAVPGAVGRRRRRHRVATWWRWRRSRGPAPPTRSSCRSTTRCTAIPCCSSGPTRSGSASSRPGLRPRPRLLRADRAPGRLRRRATRPRVARRDGDHYVSTAARCSSPTAARRPSRSSSPRPTGAEGHRGITRLPRREGHARLHRGQDRGQARHPRLRHRGAGVRGLPGAGRAPARRGGRGLQDRA